MESVNWLAVILAAGFAVTIAMVWYGPIFRVWHRSFPGDAKLSGKYRTAALVLFIGSAMLGHNFARIGSETLGAKPWLFFMQSGGFAVAFIIPAIWLTHLRMGIDSRTRLIDCGYWLTAYLAMGGVFWGLS
ncbi:MAG: DUF1761 domain-containing protein [Sphingomonadaceae bacterium]|nr:DUF1761 domain-containing protein [Sphingomonadaceae bacterium]